MMRWCLERTTLRVHRDELQRQVREYDLDDWAYESMGDEEYGDATIGPAYPGVFAVAYEW